MRPAPSGSVTRRRALTSSGKCRLSLPDTVQQFVQHQFYRRRLIRHWATHTQRVARMVNRYRTCRTSERESSVVREGGSSMSQLWDGFCATQAEQRGDHDSARWTSTDRSSNCDETALAWDVEVAVVKNSSQGAGFISHRVRLSLRRRTSCRATAVEDSTMRTCGPTSERICRVKKM